VVRKCAAPVTDAKGSLEVRMLTQRKQATWPGATSVKMENRTKKKIGDSVVVPVDAGENGGARASAFGSGLSCTLIEFIKPAWHCGVSKLHSLASGVSRTRSAWVDDLTGGGSSWQGTAAASRSNRP
jgi:hypothetical protein